MTEKFLLTDFGKIRILDSWIRISGTRIQIFPVNDTFLMLLTTLETGLNPKM